MDSMRPLDTSPSLVSLSSSTTRCHFLDCPPSLLRDSGPSHSLVLSAPLARPFVLSFFFYPLISLAGHWFGFAIPSLSLSGASVVAEENRYPFYVFIISQIKKLMN